MRVFRHCLPSAGVGLLWATGVLAQPAPRDIARPDACATSMAIGFGRPTEGLYQTLAPVSGATQLRDGRYAGTCGLTIVRHLGQIISPQDFAGPANVLAVATRARNELVAVTADPPQLLWLDPETRETRLAVSLSLPTPLTAAELLPHQSEGMLLLAGGVLFRFKPKGGIEQQLSLPAGVEWDGLGVLPDGMVVVSGGSVGAGCVDNTGFRRWRCPGTGRLLVLDPATLATVQDILLPETAYGAPAITNFHTQHRVYLAGSKHLMRLNYRDRRLTLDPDWRPEYVRRTQLPGKGVTIIGNYVAVRNNAAPAGEPCSVVVIGQANPKQITGLRPFADFNDSFVPAGLAADLDRSVLYVADARTGQLSSIRFDARSGEVRINWRVPQAVWGGLSLLGGLGDRLLVGTDGNYRGSSIVWRNALTGEEVLRASGLPPATEGVAPIPAYSAGIWQAGTALSHVTLRRD